MIPQVEREEISSNALVQALTAGRATLLLGQRHSPGLLDNLKRDIAAITGRAEGDDLVRLLSAVGDDSSLEGLRRAFDIHPVAPELLALAENPWSYVLTSAVDPQVYEAFRRPGSPGHQLRVLFAGRAGTLARSPSGTLTLLRLFGAMEEREAAYRPPTSDVDLKKRTRLELPIVLNELPLLIGPGGQLAVVGVGSDDWLDLEVLALSCGDLPEGSVHWFSSQEKPISDDLLRELFGERLRLYSQPLAEELERASTEDERAALQRARQQVLAPASRRMTIRRGKDSSVITFAPEEWRRLSQVAVVLDDEATQSSPLGEAQERLAFREFLYRVQRVPDWAGVARGFLFEREAASSLLALVEQEVAAPRSVHASETATQDGVSRRSSRLPIVIEGAPASGKSRLLHWLAYQLRLRGHVVVYALPSRGRTSFEQIERVCRLLERKTETTCVLIADDLDPSDYESLSEVLASSGRRSVLVGAINSIASSGRSARSDAPDDRYAPRASYTPFSLESRLTEVETDRFLDFLAARGFPEIQLAREIVRQRLFLLLLYRLLPDSRGNIHLSVAQEYERLAVALDGYLDAEDEHRGHRAPDWKDQLEAVRAALFPEIEGAGSEADSSPFRHERGVVNAVQLALFCSQIERPLSLDLLVRIQGARFLNSYQAFSRAMDETALLQETVLDADGTVGVEAEHPFVAEVTLRSLLPDRAAQLSLIDPLIKAVRWDETAFPGDNPDQDYAVSVLQAVGPRGAVGDNFKSRDSLERLVQLLSEVRIVHGTRLPQLLLLEANALRLISNWLTSSFEDSIARFSEAIEILADAEHILAARRPSSSRNSQLQNVLTTRAVVHGYVCGACLQEYTSAGPQERSRLRETLKEQLDEVNRATVRARSMGRASYRPLDVSFWAHRDQLERLPDLSDEERVSLLAKLESVLEVAVEEPIEMGQLDRYQRRIADLADLQGDITTVEAVAEELRAKGDFSADCIIARRKAIDPTTRRIRSTEAAHEALDDLLTWTPAILGSEEALALMHRLWLGAHLSGQEIGGEEPVLAKCAREDWTVWRRILEGRLAFPANESNPYLNFCLAWVLLSVDEPMKAVQVLRSNEALAVGNRRRVGTLAVITDPSGTPIEYSGTVRRMDGQQIALYVPRLLSEIKAPARIQPEFAVSVHVGDEWRFAIGLNYQGLLPVPRPF